MPRKPKPKNALSAGERVALYMAEQEEKQRRMTKPSDNAAENGGAERTDEDGAPTNKAENKVSVPKTLPKPQHAVVNVDLSMQIGQVKAMHGMCNGPVSYGANISGLFREIGVPLVRFDGADGAISRRAIDISRIFKDMNADPSKPESYDFEYTDKYIAAAYNSGAEIILRLGESRDMLEPVKLDLPNNVDLFAHVCANIIRHYNDYWAGGYAYGIRYFEVWSHYDEDGLQAELELYVRVANALKIYDENIKIGGFCAEPSSPAVRELVKYCKKNRAPLDFIALECLGGDVEAIAGEVEGVAMLLGNLGFNDTEIMIGKWCYIDKDAIGATKPRTALARQGAEANLIKKAIFDSQCSVKGAAFAAALMIRLAGVRGVKAACFYDAQPMISPFCAISDRFGQPQKPFYAFRAFGELYKAGGEVYAVSEQNEGFAHSGIYAMAANGESGESYIYIVSFGGCGVVDLRIDGISSDVYSADVYMLDGVKDMTLADSVALSGMKKRLLLNLSEYGAALIKLY